MTGLRLQERDRALLDGEEGEAARLAMRMIVRVAEITGAQSLIDVTCAHIDGCLYHGRASLDLAERLVALGARVTVPTTLNVGLLDLLHPELNRADHETAGRARRLMDCYVAMGCEPTWTCAPYQLPRRPRFGEQIAWAESNAIVFANSVLGARTDRYGDFIDIFAAITGRVPDAGLHREENRRGQVLFVLHGVPDRLLAEDVLYPVLGHLVGAEAGTRVPVIDGLPEDTSEDRLKALGAAAASSGAVALFHAVGVTPEAPTLDAALQGGKPERIVEVTPSRLRAARDALSNRSRPSIVNSRQSIVDSRQSTDDRLAAVSLGTPHFSLAEFEQLMRLLGGRRVHDDVALYVSTARHIEAELEVRGWAEILRRAGAHLVVDTCTYLTPIIPEPRGVVMTNSAKWAYYAPGNIGVDVVFGSLDECVASAVEGRIVRSDALWAEV
ncbi:MAG: aconitase X [Longimicrobiales bacterium]